MMEMFQHTSRKLKFVHFTKMMKAQANETAEQLELFLIGFG